MDVTDPLYDDVYTEHTADGKAFMVSVTFLIVNISLDVGQSPNSLTKT